MRRAMVVMLLVASGAFAAQRDPAKYDRVLLPFSGSTAGPAGSWFVQWWLHNDSDTSVDVFPLATFCGLCPPTFRISIAGSIPPHSTPLYIPGDVLPGPQAPLGPAILGTPPGVLLYVEHGKADQLAITGFLARFTFRGPQRRSVSSALRAIHEDRFRRGRQSILLPVLADTRTTLRVYALPESVDNTAVTVRWFTISELAGISAPDEELLGTAVVNLTTPDSEGFRSECAPPCDVPRIAYKPAVAEMPITSLPVLPTPAIVRIEIEPSSPNVKWWAVVSATNASDDVQFFELSDF